MADESARPSSDRMADDSSPPDAPQAAVINIAAASRGDGSEEEGVTGQLEPLLWKQNPLVSPAVALAGGC